MLVGVRTLSDLGAAMAAVLTVMRPTKSEIERPETVRKPMEVTHMARLRTPACETLRTNPREPREAPGD